MALSGRLGRALLMMLVLGCCATAVLALGERNRPAPIWPCSAITVAALLLSQRREWLPLLAGGLLGLIIGPVLVLGVAPLNALILAPMGQGEALACALLLRRAGLRRADLARPRDLGWFALIALLIPLASGLPAMGFLAAVRGAPFLSSLTNWWLAHGLGLALLVPLLVVVARSARSRPRSGLPRTLACLGLVVLAAILAFNYGSRPFLFLTFPPVMLAAWQGGMPGAAAAVALVAAIGLTATVAGPGQVATPDDLNMRLKLLQAFLLVLAGTALTMASLLAANDRLRRHQQRAALAMQRQTRVLDSALAAMEQGLAAFDRNGRLLAANARYAAITGLPPQLVRPGVAYLDLLRWLAEHGHYGPGDPAALAQRRLSTNGAGRLRHLARTRPDGRSIEVTGRPLLGGGWVNTCTDVTERVERERQLARSEAGFRLLTEHSGDVVARVGLDGGFAYVSPAALHVLGWAPEALTGRALLDLVEAEDRAWVASSWAALAAGQTEESTITFRTHRADDSEAWVEAHARLRRDDAGAPAEVVLAMRDATDRKAAESQLLAAYEQMEAMAQTDGLTGLANRRRFDELLEREWRRAAREGAPLALVLVDADRFKLYNDHYGHAAGDECLRRVALAVAGAARRPGDLAARYGGEEFALLLPGADLLGAIEIAERLRRDLQAQAMEHSANPPGNIVTISLGVACVAPKQHHAPDPDALLRSADQALYAAKAGGRNRVSAGGEPVAA
jgi:diguanylate cyclase (GGDEF)-like protein/PAS domain S-box-containing protein